MNFDLPSTLQLFLTIAGFAGLLGVAYAVFNSNKYNQSVKILESTVKAYKDRNDLLTTQYEEEKKERKELQTQFLELKHQFGQLQGQLKAYQELIKNPATLESNITKLTTAIDLLVANTTENKDLGPLARAFIQKSGKFFDDYEKGKITLSTK